MPDDEGLREELAAALLSADYESIDFGEWRDLVADEDRDQYDAYLDALLPVVERYAARRAAEAWTEAADLALEAAQFDWVPPIVRQANRLMAESFRENAAAVRTEPHPAHRHDETEAGRG